MTTFLNSRRVKLTWIAALVHRISGLALATFLPIHFFVLGLALNGEGKLNDFLRWTDWRLVKLAEGGLVFFLVIHMLGGLRVLLLENSQWRGGQAKLAASAGGISILLAVVFLVRVL